MLPFQADCKLQDRGVSFPLVLHLREGQFDARSVGAINMAVVSGVLQVGAAERMEITPFSCSYLFFDTTLGISAVKGLLTLP